jgi:hypothetical protein
MNGPEHYREGEASDATCRYGTHAPRDCPARVFALSGTTPPACPVLDVANADDILSEGVEVDA